MIADEHVMGYIADAAGRFLLGTARVARYLGTPPGHLEGVSIDELLSEDAADAWRRGDQAALQSGSAVISEDVLPGEREETRFLTIRLPLIDGDGKAYAVAALGADITDRARAERELRERHERLAHEALHDPLTGLANRRFLREHLELALARARRRESIVALVFLDVDGLKRINDLHGHSAGDDVLRQMARRLRATVRETDLLVRSDAEDSLVARHGGDEFLLVLADVEVEAAVCVDAVTGRLRQRLAEPFPVNGSDLDVRASIGVSLFPRDAQDPDTLIARADEAMYRMKRGG